MYSAGASGVVGGRGQVSRVHNTPSCICPSSSPSATMIEPSVVNAACFRWQLLPPATSVLCQTSRVRGQSVCNVRDRSLHHLSSAYQVASKWKISLEFNSVPWTFSRKFQKGRSAVSVSAEPLQSTLAQKFATESPIHSNGLRSDTANDRDSGGGSVFSSQESLRPEHVFVRPHGVPPFSAKEFESDLEIEAWELLRSSIVTYGGNPVGTIAAQDPTTTSPLNYDQVFIRDFIPSAIAFLLKGEHEIVQEFLLNTLRLQVLSDSDFVHHLKENRLLSWEKTVDCYNPGQGLMPASFKVRTVPVEGEDETVMEEILDPDFGEAAIGRVAPVDSGLWWIILLRAYGKSTGDYSLQRRLEVQTGMRMILKLCLADGFDMFPTLLVTDGSCMIDRRMGIHGHPLEIQALFYSALRCAREMLIDEDSVLLRSINSRLSALLFHVREYYWLDMKKLNEIYRYQTEEYSYDAVNKFNIYPDQIPGWLLDWIPDQGGYLIGNLQPAHMDFRVFSLGNLWSVAGSLSSPQQSEGILDLIEARWKDFVGTMPFKIAFPALELEEWRIITGADPKNTPWSYHNSGSWPVLLWQTCTFEPQYSADQHLEKSFTSNHASISGLQFTVACIKMGRQDLAQRAIEVAEQRLSNDRWPEYYDTRFGRLIGKQARLQQTWTIAGFLVAKMLLKNPEAADILTCDEDPNLLLVGATSLEDNPRKRRGRKRELV